MIKGVYHIGAEMSRLVRDSLLRRTKYGCWMRVWSVSHSCVLDVLGSAEQCIC